MFPWYLAPLAFVFEYIDCSLGMGYGTCLSPLLLLLGLLPAHVVPAVILSQLVADVLGVVLHQRAGNVDFRFGAQDIKVALVLTAFSTVGVVTAVVVSTNLPPNAVKLYISALVLAMALLIPIQWKERAPRFSWLRLSAFGAVNGVAAFNKGISGGGYGPVVMTGQLVSGVRPKNAVGITCFGEALTCLIGVAAYLVLRPDTSWRLALPLTLGAGLAVPFAALTVRWLKERWMTFLVAALVFILGVWSLLQALR